jgi:periodic tryptophan protein 1
MSMITAIQWVPRGFAAPFPTQYELTEAEFERIAELAKLQLDDANEDLEDAKGGDKKGQSSKNEDEKEKTGKEDE